MLSNCAHKSKWECPSADDDVEYIMVWGNSDLLEPLKAARLTRVLTYLYIRSWPCYIPSTGSSLVLHM